MHKNEPRNKGNQFYKYNKGFIRVSAQKYREKSDLEINSHTKKTERITIGIFGNKEEPEASPDILKLNDSISQYAQIEVTKAIDAFRLLIKVRDRCREQNLIDW